jgi:hypothetical protein
VTYLIRVNGLVHHGTSHQQEHEEYAARLREAGHDVTTEEES